MTETTLTATEETTDVGFTDIRAQLKKVAEQNALLVFDYNTSAGRDDARSQIASLKSMDKAAWAIHKKVKAAALKRCQTIDGVRREISGEINAMIAVHKEPLDRIAAENAAREKAAADLIAKLNGFSDRLLVVETAAEATALHAELVAIEIVSPAVDAERIKAATLPMIEKRRYELAAAESLIAKLAEMEAKEKLRDQADREKKIAEEAAAKAKADAEAAAKEKAEADANRIKLAEAAKEKAEREAAEAKETAEREAREAATKAKADAEAAKAKRLADEEHVARVKQTIAEDLVAKCGMSLGGGVAAQIVNLIASGEIPNVTIKF